MRKARFMFVAALLLTMYSGGLAADKPAADKPATPPLRLKVGDMAPDFSMLTFDGAKITKVSLADYRGKKNVALAFYVFAFTGG